MAKKNSPSSLPFPILISCICSCWRALAYQTPRLWCTIFLPEVWDCGRETTSDWFHRWSLKALTIAIRNTANLGISLEFLTRYCILSKFIA
ncbi:hypothetical protein CPB83DRAFT_612322 [Crepidotus variabilis]|uniref:F-box domain-containing protein n=1 Tax=Crepidotus variabilis TaxID=179855 RepID=A0A9P6E8D0_9AGAR|nr:hypothetical protein CPB83DRAFT_612322 [Crepidotus variabilis]